MPLANPAAILEAWRAQFATQTADGSSCSTESVDPWVDVAVLIVLLRGKVAWSDRIAIVILRWDTDTVLFQEFIEGYWSLFLFDVMVESPSECQWAVSMPDGRGEDLFWLQFSTVEERARFEIRFTQGKEMAKMHLHSLRIQLTSFFNIIVLPPRGELLSIGCPQPCGFSPGSSVDAITPAVLTSKPASSQNRSEALSNQGSVCSGPHVDSKRRGTTGTTFKRLRRLICLVFSR